MAQVLGTTHEPWVGRSVPGSRTTPSSAARAAFRRPRPGGTPFHAAIVRSQLAHARITVDAAAAAAAPGVVGVLTGDDVAALSRPFPAGSTAASPTTRPRSTPSATSASRSRSSSPRAATSPRTRPSSSRSTTTRSSPCSTRSPPCPCTSARFPTATSRRPSRAPMSSSAGVPLPPLHVHPGRVLRGRRRLERDRGPLTAWANFQGPFTLHGVAAAALGLRGDAAAADAARLRGSFGIKSSVFGYVVLLGLAARSSACPSPGPRTGSSTSRRAPPRRVA